MIRLVKLFFSDILARAFPFFLLPVVSQYLSVIEFSQLGLYQNALMIFVVFIGFGLNNIVSISVGKNEKKVAQYIYQTVIFSVFSFTVINILITFFDFDVVYRYAVIVAFLNFYILLIKDILIVKGEINKILISNVVYIFILYSIFICFLHFELGYTSRFYSDVIAAFVYILLSTFLIKELICNWLLSYKINKKKYFDVKHCTVAIPLMLRQLYPWIKTAIERYVISSISTLTVLGQYTLAFQVVSLIGAVIGTLISYFTPRFYSYLNTKDYVSYRKVVIRLTGLFLIIIAALTTILPYLIEFFFDVTYQGANDYVILISLSYGLFWIQTIFWYFFSYYNKTMFPFITQLTLLMILIACALTVNDIFTFLKIGLCLEFFALVILSRYWSLCISKLESDSLSKANIDTLA